jgi:hypothetical protein
MLNQNGSLHSVRNNECEEYSSLSGVMPLSFGFDICGCNLHCVRYEVLTAVSAKIAVFLDVEVLVW